MRAESEGLIGITGLDGSIEFDIGDIRELESIHVSTKSHIPHAISPECLADGEEIVFLSTGIVLAIQCRDAAGAGLGNCRVFASRAQLPPQAEARQSTVGGLAPGNDKSALRWGDTNGDGFTVLTGLSQAEYQIGAVLDGHSTVGIDPSGVIRLVGDTAATIVLAPVVAAVFSTNEDDIVTYTCRRTKHSHADTDAYLHGSQEWQDTLREERALKARFPNACVAVYVGTAPFGGDDTASVTLLSKSHGVVDTSIPLLPPAAIAAPLLIGPEGQSAKPIVLSPTVVTVRDADGRDIAAELFAVSLSSELTLRLRNGTMDLPVGTHTIVCQDDRLYNRFSPRVVELPGQIDIRLDFALSPCRLRVMCPDGAELGRFYFSATAGGKTTKHYVLDNRDRVFWFPAGPLSLTVGAWGLGESHDVQRIEASTILQQIEVVLRD